jgi:type VI secretion system protein ImpL
MLLAIVLVALLIVAASWTGVLILGAPMWVGIAATIAAVAIIVGFVVFRRLRAIARASALERELLRQASHAADQSRPERRAEVLALQASMKQAIDALKRTKLGGRGGKAALYALPWYVVVGPPAAGKTTALKESGLSFASAAPNAPKIKGTAGTKNCDWWFSREAILLDTAGRFATDDDDRDEWTAFLATIKRFRPERPLDGMIVAISAAELAGASEAQIDELAEKLRTRVDEVASQLEMVVPIYVMLTKVDLVAGFVEFWGDLGKQQRAQAWGTTFTLDDERLEEPAALCEAEFDLLMKTLHAHMIERLAREPMPEVRTRVLQFPLEFKALRSPLAHFIEQLCLANPYQETPWLRGFYFTSGTQLGRPMDRVLSNMARGFDLGLAPAPDRHGASQSISYFVTDLFRSIIFPDRDLAMRSSSRVRRHLQKQIAYAAIALVTTMMLVLPAIVSYFNDVDLVRATLHDVEAMATFERDKTRTTVQTTEALGGLVQRVQALEEAKSRFRIPGVWGLSSAARLYDPVDAHYLVRLREVIEGPVRNQIKSDVRAIADSIRTDASSFQSAYDGLKLYIMMALPERLDVDWASKNLAEKWSRALRKEASFDAEKLVAHTRRYADALAADHKWAWPLDESLVGQARARISGLKIEELQYAWLAGSAASVPPIVPRDIFYGASEQFVDVERNVQVPGMYTAAGWEKIRATLDSPTSRLDIEPWVIGTATPSSGDVQNVVTEKLRKTYFQRYVRAWSDFLSGLKVQTPNDIDSAVAELTAISELDGPYTRLFQSISENVRLDVEPRALSEKLAEKGKDLLSAAVEKMTGKDAGGPSERRISPVEQHFKFVLHFAFGDSRPGKADAAPSGLSIYLANVKSLAVQLDQLAKGKEAPKTEFQEELSRTAAVVKKQLVDLDRPAQQVLEPLLMNPIRGSQGSVTTSSNTFLDDKWKAEVFEIWREKLANRYPFADAPQDVAIADFADFFRPQTGALWKFYEANLAERLERSGNAFKAKASADPVPFRGEFLRFIGYAQEIADAVFGAGPEPAVVFDIQMHSVPNIGEIKFWVDGQASTYQNGPEQWLRTQWPAKAGPHRGLLQLKGATITDEFQRQGDFGLFRLLAAGGIKPLGAGANVFAASWDPNRPGQQPVKIEFRPVKSAHPFEKDFFRRVKCPPEIIQANANSTGRQVR